MVGQDALEDGPSAAPGQMDVEQDDIRHALINELDGRRHFVRFADHVDRLAQFGPYPGPEDGMVLDQEEARPPRPSRPPRSRRTRTVHQTTGSRRGMDSSTSAPWPGAERMTADPPDRVIRDRMDWAMPTILRHAIGVEPVAPVTDEEHHHVGLDLGVERDLGGAGPFGGVDGGFPGGIEQGANPSVSSQSPTITTCTSMPWLAST